MESTRPAVREKPVIPRRADDGTKLPFYLNQRRLTSHIFFGPYIYIPIACSLAWLAALLALIGVWVRAGKPRYDPSEPSVVYISNVAGKHKAIFIPLTAVVCVLYVLSLLVDRVLRLAGRLPGDIRKREPLLGWFAIFWGLLGGAALVLLAVFDNFNHSAVHWSMACVFIVCTALSAICQTGQIWSLHKDHPLRRSLIHSSLLKFGIVIFDVLGAIAFAALYGVCRGNSHAHGSHSAATCNRVSSGAAAMEWTIAFVLVLYFLTLVVDLWQAGKTSPRYRRALEVWQEKHSAGAGVGGVGGVEGVRNGVNVGGGERVYREGAYGNVYGEDVSGHSAIGAAGARGVSVVA